MGFGHAYLTLSDEAEVQYKASAPYDPASEITVLWNDPELGISWPVDAPVLDWDRNGVTLREFAGT